MMDILFWFIRFLFFFREEKLLHHQMDRLLRKLLFLEKGFTCDIFVGLMSVDEMPAA